MTTVKQLIEALQTLPETWMVHMDSVGHVCISNERKQVAAVVDIATAEIDRFDDAESP